MREVTRQRLCKVAAAAYMGAGLIGEGAAVYAYKTQFTDLGGAAILGGVSLLPIGAAFLFYSLSKPNPYHERPFNVNNVTPFTVENRSNYRM